MMVLGIGSDSILDPGRIVSSELIPGLARSTMLPSSIPDSPFCSPLDFPTTRVMGHEADMVWGAAL